MSAQAVAVHDKRHEKKQEEAARLPRLKLVQAPTATVSTMGFVGIILGLIALGLGIVMIVSTTAGAQSRELTALRNEATELGYQTAALQSQMQRLSSASALAMRATELGMVPNPYPAFINLGDGSVTGDPTPVTGDEMTFLRGARTNSSATSGAASVPSIDVVVDGDAAEADVVGAEPAEEPAEGRSHEASVADEVSEESLLASEADEAQEDQ